MPQSNQEASRILYSSRPVYWRKRPNGPNEPWFASVNCWKLVFISCLVMVCIWGLGTRTVGPIVRGSALHLQSSIATLPHLAQAPPLFWSPTFGRISSIRQYTVTKATNIGTTAEDGSLSLKADLDFLYNTYATPAFIDTDPIQFPHRYTNKADIEIIGFVSAILAFGGRKGFIPKLEILTKQIESSGLSPSEFIFAYDDTMKPEFRSFKYRFFTSDNLHDYLMFLKSIYTHHNGLHGVVRDEYMRTGDLRDSIQSLRTRFLESSPTSPKSINFIGNPKSSACKKMNMFLRWMVRKDAVDFGLWTEIPTSKLYLPLDVHSFQNSQALGLTTKRTPTFRATIEITEKLAALDPLDPIKYDFALYGMGAIG